MQNGPEIQNQKLPVYSYCKIPRRLVISTTRCRTVLENRAPHSTADLVCYLYKSTRTLFSPNRLLVRLSLQLQQLLGSVGEQIPRQRVSSKPRTSLLYRDILAKDPSVFPLPRVLQF